MAQGINIDNAVVAANTSYSKDRVSTQTDAAQSSSDGFSYIFEGEPSTSTRVNKTMDQFEEYLKNQQEKAKESGEDEASQEKADKEAAKEIRNNVSSEELKQLAMMGVDVDSARLSDLQGMLNTLRGKNHREETQELFAQIKADSGDVEKLVVTGDGVKVAGTDVSVNVSVADVAEDKSQNELQGKNVQTEKKNVPQDEGFKPGKNELAYMVRNNLALNKENLYKAHFSGEKADENGMDDKTFEEISGQVSEIIDKTGIGGFDMSDARFLLDNDLPVNADSIRLVAQFKNVMGQNISDVNIPENDDESVKQAAEELYKKTLFIEPETVQEMAEGLSDSGSEITIQTAYVYQQDKLQEENGAAKKIASKSDNTEDAKGKAKQKTSQESAVKEELAGNVTAAGVTAKRQLVEIQLSMTLQVANRMARLDINVDTKSLSETLDILRQAEREILKESLANSGVEPTDENADMLSETIAGVEKLGDADASVLAAPLRGSAFTVRGLNEASDLLEAPASDFPPDEQGTTGADDELRRNLQKTFEGVRRSYEAVGTAPRSDMGDSITKAFSNIDELLEALDIDVNDETKRAAKILGYNNLEITQENIDGVADYDREVNRLMDSFYPEAVMGLIKDGINPMDVPIDELNNIISEKNYNEGVTEAKNFATYLRDVEKRGEISEDERKSYIGLYRVMDKLEKSGDREAGFLFANQSNLTIRNMISAMRSRKAKGLSADIDDSFGMLESADRTGIGMDEQIEAGFKTGFSAGEGAGSESDLASEYGQTLEQFKRLNENTERFIQENGIEYNISNAITADALLNENEGVYKLIYEAMEKLKFNDMTRENLVDEETGNMAASMMGEDVDVDPMEGLSTENLLRQLEENGDLSLTYEDIRNQLTEMMYDAGAAGLISSLDISAIKSATSGVNLLGQLSKNDRYQIPVETGQGRTVANITLKGGANNDESSTVIEAYMKTEGFGNLTVRLGLSEDTDGSINVSGEFTSDSAEGNEALSQMSETAAAFLERLGETLGKENINGSISFGTVVQDAEQTGANVSHGTACRVAVETVRTMMEICS